MDGTAYSWLRRSVSKIKKTYLPSSTTTPSASAFSSAAAYNNKSIKNKSQKQKEDEEKIYGITDQLIECVKSLNLETFKNFRLSDEEESSSDGGSCGNLRTDLSDWQEKHAMLTLSRIKELAQLHFKLCPRYLKERQFWRIYFTLVRSYVAEYELRAVQSAKLRQMRMGDETVTNSTCACEVEMSEAKFSTSMEETASSMEQK